MKTILVPVEHHEATRNVLRLAIMTARKLDAVIEGFALRAPPIEAIGWDPASVAMFGGTASWDRRSDVNDAREVFEQMMREAHVPGGGPAGIGFGWRWLAGDLGGDELLAIQGRAHDLTVVGQPSSDGTGCSITTLESALFDSGGPILIAPRVPVAEFGGTMVIAWNGSSETARTIAFSGPFLRLAKRVIILADDGSVGHRPTGDQIRRRLELNGISAELRPVSDGRIRSGEHILSEAASLGCDLLLKGAYTQSRLRQMIFGGATQHILAEARIPVFMAH